MGKIYSMGWTWEWVKKKKKRVREKELSIIDKRIESYFEKVLQ